MEYYTGVLQHPETQAQYYPVTLWELIIGRPTNFSDVYNSTINLYAGTAADHTDIGSFTVNSQSNVDIYFPVASTTAMGLVPILDGDTTHFLRGDGTWATPAGGGGGGGGEENVQSDWDVTDTTSDAYIKHKPDVDKVTQETLSSGSRPILLAEKSTPDSNAPNKAKYSSKITASPSSIVVEKADGLARTEWTGDRPFKMQTRLNTSASWSLVEDRIIASNGLLPAPTVGKFLKYESTGFAWDDTPTGSDTTYQLTLNGTTNGDSTGGVDLGTLYAPTGAGTSGYILKSNGSGAPSWDTLINIIGSKTEHYVLAGNSSGNVSWQQLDLAALSDTPTENKITLNGTDNAKFLRANGTSGDLTFYAPTSGKATNNLLLSQGTGANPPTWTNFTFPSSGTTKTLNYVGGTGWTIQELMSAASTSSTYHGYLLMHPVSGGNQEMKYNTQVFTGFDGSTGYVLAGNTSSNTDMVYLQGSLTTPILLKSGSNVIPNKLIHSSGVIAAPTGSSGDTKYLKADIGNNNSVTFGWATISGGGGGDTVTGKTVTLGTTGQAVIQVNGSDSGSVSLPAASSSTAGITLVGSTSGGASAYNHVHGSITNAGAITSDTTIGSQDHLVITDHSDSNKIKRTSITFGSSTTTFLSNDGQWRTPAGGSSNPTHLDAWIGHSTTAHDMTSMDAPFFCTDLASPTYSGTNYSHTFTAFPGLSSQWGVYDTVVIPEHITLWPKGTHAMNREVSTGCDNWMAVMMTSWAAGHPMSMSMVRSGVRTWIPLVYVGPLTINGVVRSVAIDLGAAIILHLVNDGLVNSSNFPFAMSEGEPNTYSLTSAFCESFSIGTTPITFRYFKTGYTNGCSNLSSMEPSGGSNQLISFINSVLSSGKVPINFTFTATTGKTLEGEWSKIPGWEAKGEAGYEGNPITDWGIGGGIIFQTWQEIINDKDYGYEGVLVCTALPNIINIQHKAELNE